MAKLTRRGLLKGTSIGVATAGVIAGGAFALPNWYRTSMLHQNFR
ncbi:MAG: twin-arginine translocation signal domain-containing protein [Ktedonobacteraceae bacterium]|nr:twin-arginine translocation signal domain-containing protein [Ktedonobacteraceae bacterium]